MIGDLEAFAQDKKTKGPTILYEKCEQATAADRNYAVAERQR